MAAASTSRCFGDGLSRALLDQDAEFTIEARDSNGVRCVRGGDSFFVSVRSIGTRFRCKVSDNSDGTYSVIYKSTVSGPCEIVVSLLGEALPGSPFSCSVSPPVPHATQCSVHFESSTLKVGASGSASTWTAVSHQPFDLQVRFRDVLGNLAHAVELDIYPQRAESIAGVSSRSKGGTLAISVFKAMSQERFRSPRGDARLQGLQSPRKGNGELLNALPVAPPFVMTNGAVIHGEDLHRTVKSIGHGINPLHAELAMLLREHGELPGAGAEILESLNEFEQVVVGHKPLLVTQAKACDSQQIGYLQPGHILKFIRIAVVPIYAASETPLTRPSPPLKAAPPARGGCFFGLFTKPTPKAESKIIGHIMRACVVLDDDVPALQKESWRGLYPNEQDWRSLRCRVQMDDVNHLLSLVRSEIAEIDAAERAKTTNRPSSRSTARSTVRSGMSAQKAAEAKMPARASSRLVQAPAPASEADTAAGVDIVGAVVSALDADGDGQLSFGDMGTMIDRALGGVFGSESNASKASPKGVAARGSSPKAVTGAKKDLKKATGPPTRTKGGIKDGSPTKSVASKETSAADAEGEAKVWHAPAADAFPQATVGVDLAGAVVHLLDADGDGKLTFGGVGTAFDQALGGVFGGVATVMGVASANEQVPIEGTTAEVKADAKAEAKKKKISAKKKADSEKLEKEREEAERLAAKQRAEQEAIRLQKLTIYKSVTRIQAHHRGHNERRNVEAYREQLRVEAEEEAARVAAEEAERADAQLSRRLVRAAFDRGAALLTPQVKLNLNNVHQLGHGWVTISTKEEAHLIQKRMGPLPAHVRRQQIETWQRRFAIDSARERERAAERDAQLEAMCKDEQLRIRRVVKPEGEPATDRVATLASSILSAESFVVKPTKEGDMEFEGIKESRRSREFSFSREIDWQSAHANCKTEEATVATQSKDKEDVKSAGGKQRPQIEGAADYANGKPATIGKQPPRRLRAKQVPSKFGFVLKLPRAAYLEEIEVDPSGVGFAYGGITPETYGLNPQRDKPPEEHQVHISIGQSGTYLLHVALRHSATPLPGSPFLLHVMPGSAHPLSTMLTPAELPLLGFLNRKKPFDEPPASVPPPETALQKLIREKNGLPAPKPQPAIALSEPVLLHILGESCVFTLLSRDKMGNVCAAGGASVSCGVLGHEAAPQQNDVGAQRPAIRCEVEDKRDGRYLLRWWVQEAGTYDIFIKMDGLHILGSPAQMVIEADQAAFDAAVERQTSNGDQFCANGDQYGADVRREAQSAAKRAAELAANEAAEAAALAAKRAEEEEARRKVEEEAHKQIEFNRNNMLKLKAEADARRAKEAKLAAMMVDEEKRAKARAEAMERTKKMKAGKG